MIILHASDPSQVASASSFEVLLGDPAVRLMIFSGIAIPERHVNDDGHLYPDEIVVKLGVNVSLLVKAVSHIGLASISNDDTAFTFATDSGTVEVESGTGELQLRVQSSLRGEDTYLHRFGYQIVAHVRKVSARIAGTITVPRAILDLTTLQPVEVPAQFVISANTVESVPDPSGIFGNYERVTPIAWGRTGELRNSDSECFVDYTIDGCPFNVPLRVVVEAASGSILQSRSAVCSQVAGPRPVLLTNVAPEVDGVDFLVSQMIIR
jgi:hypothetical protein